MLIKIDNKNRVFLYLALIILAGLAFRLQNISFPLVDLQPWRQSETAMIARNFFLNGMHFFSPQLDWAPDVGGYVESEFPLFNYIVALIYMCLGYVDETVGRLLAVFFYVLTTIYLYFFCRDLLGEKRALFASLVYTTMPLSLIFTRTFLPESAMVFYSVFGFYYLQKWLKSSKGWDIFLSICGFSLTYLTKVYMAHLLLPIVIMLFYSQGKLDCSRKTGKALIMILPVCAVALWFIYSSSMPANNGIFSNNDKWGNLFFLTTPDFFQVVGGKIVNYIISPPGIPFFILGFYSFIKKRDYFFIGYFLSVMAFIFIVAKGNYVHPYYPMPLTAVFAVYIAEGICEGIRYFSNDRLKKGFGVLVIIGFLAMGQLGAWQLDKHGYKQDYLDAADGLKQISQPKEWILTDTMDPSIMYYSERQGFRISPENISVKALEGFRIKNVKYFLLRVSTTEYLQKESPKILQDVKKLYPVEIFRLQLKE
jgi:4-amino-4-deoxy-L-arabinose transferase-like glycosyltransferase